MCSIKETQYFICVFQGRKKQATIQRELMNIITISYRFLSQTKATLVPWNVSFQNDIKRRDNTT